MNVLLLFSIVTGIFSFKKDDPEEPVRKNHVYHTAKSYNAVITKGIPTFGNFSFQEYHGMVKEPHPLGVNFSGSFWDKTKRVNLPINADAMIGGINLSKPSDLMSYDYHLDSVTRTNNVYGKKVYFKVNVLTSPSFYVSDSVYIPGTIELDFPDYIFMLSNQDEVIEATDLSVGQTIYWNADSLNPKGVCLLIEYYSNESGNGNLEKRGNKKPAFNWVFLDDNGSYKLQPGLFKGIPDKAAITLTISRGNYAILKDATQPGKDISLTGYSRQQGMFRYKKK